MIVVQPRRRILALVVAVALVLAVLPSGFASSPASSSTAETVSYGFEGPSDITDNFVLTFGTSTPDSHITRGSTGGIANSGAVVVAETAGQAVMGSRTTYTMAGAPDGATYKFESFVKSTMSPGYSGMGFSTLPSAASLAGDSGLVYRPNDALGISVHGSGFIFHNGASNHAANWNAVAPSSPITRVQTSVCSGLIDNPADGVNSSCGSSSRWYRIVLLMTLEPSNKFDLRVEVWPTNENGVNRDSEASAIFELRDVTNTTIRGAATLSSYVNFSGKRFSAFDNYSVTLDGGSTFVEAGAPVVTTTSASGSGYVVTVGGNLTSANGGTISDRGFVYSTSANPTTSDTKVSVGSAPFSTGAFSGSTPSLSPGTYNFRAFAVNENSTSYGANQTVVISHPISSMGFTETAVESGKNVGTTLNGGTATVSGVNGVCYASDDGGTVTGLETGSTAWAVTDAYSRTNTTASVVSHSFLFFYDGTSSSVPANCNFVSNTANPSVRSSFLSVYPVGTLSSDGESATLGLDQAMTPIQSLPNAGWPGVLTYSVSPTLPPGLSLNTSTGQIAGTPTAVLSATQYTLSAKTPASFLDRVGVSGTLDEFIWDATATITLAVEALSPSAPVSGLSSGPSAGPPPVAAAPTVTPGPTRILSVAPDTSPVREPVTRPGLRFDPDAPARGSIGGVATNVVKISGGSAGVSLVAGAFQFDVSLAGGNGVPVSTSPQSAEFFVPRGESGAVSGSGSFPGSFVQLWLPNGTSSRELARIPVRSDGTFTSDVSFAAGSLEMPVPIGRQVLQVVGYDERGNQTVMDMTINIGQGAPAPEPNRQVGELPALAAGQSLGTSGGMPEAVLVTGLPDSGSVVVEGSGWVVSVSADRDTGVVENTAGIVLVRLDQSSRGTTSGSGFLPGTLATVWLFSEPTLMATVTVDDNGEFSSEFLVDARLIAPGEHTLQIQGVGTDGFIKAANLGVLVEQPIELTTESASGLLWWVLGFFVLALLLMFFVLLARRRRRQDA